MIGRKNIFLLVALMLTCIHSNGSFCARQDASGQSKKSTLLNNLRNEFNGSLPDAKETEKLIMYIEKEYGEDPLEYPATILAYYGALQGLRAKHAFNMAKKIKYLLESLKFLDASIKKDDAELETYFIRFSSLHHLPPLFGIPQKRKEDIAQICSLLLERNYSQFDEAYQLVIVKFMLESRRLSKDRITELRLLYEELTNYTGKHSVTQNK